jgi:hypothetical protein
MKPIRIPLNQFDLKRFTSEMVNFYNNIWDADCPPELVELVEDRGVPSGYIPCKKATIYRNIVSDGNALFFPFHEPNVLGFSESFSCADGQDIENVTDEEKNEVNQGDSCFLPGDLELYGYIIKKESDFLAIELAYSDCTAGPAFRIVSCDDCGLLDKPMEAFIGKFFKS